MKILILTKSFTRGGSASGASNLAMALEAAGAHVVRLDADTARNGALAAVRVGERVIERLCFDAETHCLRLASATFDLHALCAVHRPDAIQLCDISANVIRMADLAGLPCPVVHRMSDFWPYHGPRHYATVPDHAGPAGWLLRQTIFAGAPLPDMRVAPSHWLADLLARHAPDPAAIRVIRNAVAIPETARRRPPPGAGTLHFGFLSNHILDPRKGFASLQPRLEALAARGVEVSLHLFGRLPTTQTPVFSGVRVEHHGPFGRNELARVFDSFDILLCPSRLDNSPNVLCEALAHGCPVIAQRGTGMDSYLSPETGALIDFHTSDTDTLADFIHACDRIAASHGSYSSAGATHAAATLAPAIIGDAYLHLYAELLNQAPGAARP